MNKRISIKKGRKLISDWEERVNFYIESKYEGRFYIYDYLNDMDLRNEIEEYLDKLRKGKSKLIPFVEKVDLKLKSITEPSNCIWGLENQKEYNWNHSKHWWYFRRPKNMPQGWGWEDK